MTSIPSIAAIVEAARDVTGFCCFDLGAERTLVTWGLEEPHTHLDDWQDFVRSNTRGDCETQHGFTGGVVGWLGYEAGSSVEAMPTPSSPRPTHDVCLWRVDGAITIHHATSQAVVSGSDVFRAQAKALIDKASELRPHHTMGAAPLPWAPHDVPTRSSNFTAGVDRVLDHVRRGDVYQVSLAWEQTQIPVDNAAKAWLSLRDSNPATRGCFLRQGAVELVSNSPELFIELDPASRRLRSSPIKGTAACSSGAKGLDTLRNSSKERAELTMIVDLVRNDLGRVAVPGTVSAGPREVRVCGDLWHAEQTVEAILADHHDAVDAVAAAFPPGSVTGAPKVRAMQVIHHLENQPRGVYTGAIGFFGDDGSAHFNVAIRTATILDGLARFHVGAGIVADSHPEMEWHETLAKAQALAHGLSTGGCS